jgi:NADPH2:quinone reductase
MKAAVYYETGPPDVFRYEDVPDPACPSSGVLIDVEAISIEGGDVGNRAGGDMASKPHIVGYQSAGVIREVGADVTEREVGQRVVTVNLFGSHAERRAVPWQSTWVIPDGVDTKHAAAVPIPFGTADICLFEFGRLQKGETVLVQGGAGAVGIAAIQLAKRAGATTVATASSDEKLQRLKDEFGLDHGVNYATGNMVDGVRAATNGRGVDLAVDAVGTTLVGSIQCLTYKGRVVTVGDMARGRKPIDPSILMGQNLTLTGVFFGAELMIGGGHALVDGHLADIANGELKVAIDKTFPLSQAADAHAHIEARKAFGRVLLIP